MDTSGIGPITDSLFETEQGHPPAIIREWSSKLKRTGQFIFFWAGVMKAQKGSLGWTHVNLHYGDEAPKGSPIQDTPAASVERLLSPLAHEGRVRIMQALYGSPLSPSELSKASGYEGGALYHHLKELQYASYVVQKEGSYRLTELGYQLLLTVCSMAREVIADEGERGLAAGANWEKARHERSAP